MKKRMGNVSKVTPMVIKWGNMVHCGTNLLKEKHWQISGIDFVF